MSTVQTRPVFAILLMLGVCSAVLMPYRVVPIPNFLPEVLVVVMVFLAALVALGKDKFPVEAQWGWSVVCPLLLSAWLIVCIPLIQAPYPDTLVFPVTSLIAAGLVASFGVAYRRHRMQTTACTVLAIGFIVASTGTAMLQIVQLFSPDRIEFWLVPRRQHMQPFGNLAQRNHAACIHALAILSSAYFLLSRRKPHRWVLAITSVLAMAGLVMSGSRIGSILGAIGVSAFVLLAPGLRRSDGTLDLQQVLRIGVFLGLTYPLLYLSGAKLVLWTDAAQTFDGAITRWMTYGNTPRMALQELALKIFLEHPLAGSGWGSFTAQSLVKVDALRLPQYANNSHNLVTQLAAETGIGGLLAVVIPLSLVLGRALRANIHADQGYLLILCTIFLAYSITEFPLWHTFFLMPFAFALGLLDSKSWEIRLSRSMRISVIAFYVLVCVASFYFVDRYIDIARMTSAVFKPGRHSEELRAYVFNNLKAPGFSPQTELLAFGLMNVDREDLEQKIALGQRVVRQHIVPTLLTRQAGLLALNGQTEESVAHVIAACRFYPDQCQYAQAELETLSKLEPTAFLPVLTEFKKRQETELKRR